MLHHSAKESVMITSLCLKTWDTVHSQSIRQTHHSLCHDTDLWWFGTDWTKPSPREVQRLVLPVYLILNIYGQRNCVRSLLIQYQKWTTKATTTSANGWIFLRAPPTQLCLKGTHSSCQWCQSTGATDRRRGLYFSRHSSDTYVSRKVQDMCSEPMTTRELDNLEGCDQEWDNLCLHMKMTQVRLSFLKRSTYNTPQFPETGPHGAGHRQPATYVMPRTQACWIFLLAARQHCMTYM